MPCDQWFEIEKQYRLAVHAYCDAVDRLDSVRDFERAWNKLETRRTTAEQLRSSLLLHQAEHECVPARVGRKPKPAASAVA